MLAHTLAVLAQPCQRMPYKPRTSSCHARGATTGLCGGRARLPGPRRVAIVIAEGGCQMPPPHQQCRLLLPAQTVAEALAVDVAVADAAVTAVETNVSWGPARVSSKLAVSQGGLS